MSDPTENHDDPGDLSRRVAARRKALGLDIEEVAKRAGMHPAYLEYLEHHARARPTPAACARLASALETSVAWLRGAGVGLPPGHARPPTGIPRLLELEPGTCLQLLQAGGVGRAVFVDERGVPTALPVNFRVIDGDIVFRTGEGAIARAVRTGKPLSIEVDHIDEALGEGWSVLASGEAQVTSGSDGLTETGPLNVEPWPSGDRHLVVRLTPRDVTGRQIRRWNEEEG